MSRTLYDIVRILESADPDGEPLRAVLRLLREAVPCERCALLDARPGEPTRVLVEPTATGEETAQIAKELDGWVARFAVDRESSPPRGSRPGRPGAMLAVPLVGQGAVIGVLGARLAVGAPVDRHRRVLAIVGGQLAAGLSALGARAGPDAARSLDGLRVLLVDDDSDIRDAFQSVLEHYGAAVTAVGSAAAALVALARSRPDVLLSDLGMPGVNGYDLMRQVAAGEAPPPAAALTAFGEVADRELALAAGFTMQLGKPIDAAALVAAVADLAGRR